MFVRNPKTGEAKDTKELLEEIRVKVMRIRVTSYNIQRLKLNFQVKVLTDSLPHDKMEEI